MRGAEWGVRGVSVVRVRGVSVVRVAAAAAAAAAVVAVVVDVAVIADVAVFDIAVEVGRVVERVTDSDFGSDNCLSNRYFAAFAVCILLLVLAAV